MSSHPGSTASAWLVIRQRGQPKRQITLWGGIRWTIGRSMDCRIVVDDPHLSRCHAIIQSFIFQDQPLYFLADNHSSNGVLLNGYPLEHNTLLHDQDVFILGTSSFHFHYPTMYRPEVLSHGDQLGNISTQESQKQPPPRASKPSTSSVPWVG
ncbi:FHA domain-containing protein [Candidatus Synechococcus calcipolaris G9]|uniref:FHA domain-containing protein n=1 Tax=Candidatus Synechococcus calcipolaris G9 TaxID=1497997 RepID=A0ABT6F0Q4_9SYNE|nr:FHA domain-containing protein [Candidatus Synechococcus calcipolaris]MDG2991422.1 FHA domain-containing protein [Candidatus Synechococcus calcipolaris G9]